MNAPDPFDQPVLPCVRLIKPSSALSSRVLAYVSRQMDAQAEVATPQLSYFPSTPFCALIWTLGGFLEWGPVTARADADFTPLPQGVLLRGPQRKPFVLRSTGSSQTFICLLMPNALHDDGEFDPATWIDQIVPLQGVLGASWQGMARAVQAAENDCSRVALIESFLAARRAAGATTMQPGVHLHWVTWLQSLIDRSDTESMGCSLRQIERRIKSWSGASLRELRVICKVETAFFHICLAMARGQVDWAGLAHELGYADQSHLCRVIKRSSGFSPTEFLRRIQEDEAFWLYRMWWQRL